MANLKKKRTRRSFSDDFKRRLVEEANKPGVSWSEVAQRHNINTNLLFKWKEKFAGEPSFLPVKFESGTSPEPAIECTPRAATRKNDSPQALNETVSPVPALEVVLPCGSRLRCDPGFEAALLHRKRPTKPACRH